MAIENKVRRAWIINDVNEVKPEERVPGEILIDYNNNCEVFFVDDNQGLVSPTKKSKELLDSSMKTHMKSNSQHGLVSITEDGFMSSDDYDTLIKLKDLHKHIIQSPYTPIETIKEIFPNGFLQRINYKLKGNVLALSKMKAIYDGHIIDIPETIITISPRPSEIGAYEEDLICIDIDKIEKDGIYYYNYSVKYINNIKEREFQDMLPLYIIKRYNAKEFSPSNPNGTIDISSIVLDFEIVPLWEISVLSNHNLKDEIKNYAHKIINKKHQKELTVKNIHVGTTKKPITEQTLAYIDIDGVKCRDRITGVDMDKGSNFIISPVGLALYNSKERGINLPITIGDSFTLDFIIKPKNIFDVLFSFKNDKYKSLLDINIDFYNNIKCGDTILCKSCELSLDYFKAVTLIFKRDLISVYINGKLIRNIDIVENALDYLKYKMFELSALNTILCDVRLSNGIMDSFHYSKDLQDGRGLLVPTIYKDYRKLSNNVSYQYNSRRVHYTDIGNVPSNGITWNVGDKLLLEKYTNETIMGVYGYDESLCKIIGITYDNQLIVDNVNELDISMKIRAIKYNNNLFKDFIIVNIDGNKITLKDNNGIIGATKDFIGSNIFKNTITPKILLHDGVNTIDTLQYPDDEGNIMIELIQSSANEYLYLDYILVTEYDNVLPEVDEIVNVSIDNNACRKIESEISLPVKYEFISDYFNNDKYNLSNINLKPKKSDIMKINIDYDKLIDCTESNERTIIMNTLDQVIIRFNYYSSTDIKVYTSGEEQILKSTNDNYYKYMELHFHNTGNIIDLNGDLNIMIKALSDCDLLLFTDMSIEIKLKSCNKDNEVSFEKLSLDNTKPTNIITVHNNCNYIKNIISKPNNTNAIVTVLMDSDDDCLTYEKLDNGNILINETGDIFKLLSDSYEYDISSEYKSTGAYKINDTNRLYVLLFDKKQHSNKVNIHRMVNRIVTKVGDLDDSYIQ